MKCKHNTLIFLSGLVWLSAGALLLFVGLRFILNAIQFPCNQATGFSMLALLEKLCKDRTQAILFTVLLALTLGYLKGRKMLASSVARQVTRICSLPSPISLKYLYGKNYLLLLGLMVCLGILLRFLPITLDTRGFIDVTIGSALINGSMLYFRKLSLKKAL